MSSALLGDEQFGTLPQRSRASGYARHPLSMGTVYRRSAPSAERLTLTLSLSEIELLRVLQVLNAAGIDLSTAISGSESRATYSVERFGEVEVRPASRTVFRSGHEVRLSPKEFDLLVALMGRGGDVVTRKELAAELWGAGLEGSRTIDTHICSLRRKLEQNPRRPRHIISISKLGYRFER